MEMKNAKGTVRSFVMNMLRNSESDEMILSELCHAKGLKVSNAKLHLKKAKAQHKEETRTKVVKNLMSGEEMVILASTPLCCDPSSETYWSM